MRKIVFWKTKYNCKSKTRRKLFPILLLALFLLSGFVSAESDMDRRIREKNQELDNIIQLQNQKIAEKRQQAKDLQGEIKAIEEGINATQDKINSIIGEIEKTQKDIDYAENEIRLNEVVLKREQDKLKSGIALLYERGGNGSIEILVSNSSVSSFLSQENYLFAISEDISSSVQKIKNIRDFLAEKRNEAEKRRQDQEILKAEQDRVYAELQTSIMAKNTLLEQTKGDEKLYQQMLTQALQDKQQVSAMLLAVSSGASPQAIGLSYSGARAGHRVFRGEVIGRLGNTGFSTGPHLHFGVYQSKKDVDPMPLLSTNTLGFPVSGAEITQGYLGTYSHKGRSFSWPGGIDFAKAEGSPVRAAREGTIIFDGVGHRGVNSGFGHYVIIDHHNGFLTLYAHLK